MSQQVLNGIHWNYFWDIRVPEEISAPSSDTDFDAKVQIIHPNHRFEWGKTCHVEDERRWKP